MLIFSYSLDLDGAEYLSVFMMQIMLPGHSLYQNPAVFPYKSVIYTPVYSYVLYGLCRLFGVNGFSDIHSVYIIGRSLTYAAFLITLFVLDKFVRLFSRDTLVRVLCIALFTMLQSTQIFSARPDGLQLLFFTLFTYFIYKYLFLKPDLRLFACASLFGLLAIFTKQDSLVPVYTLLGLFFVFKRSRQSFFLIICFTVLLLAATGIAYLLFGREFFINTIVYNFQVVTELKKTYVMMVIALSLLRIVPLAIPVLVLAYFYQRENQKSSPAIFMAILAISYLVITHIMVLRAGSWFNYVYPAMLILVISLAMLFNGQAAWFKKISVLAYLYMAFYIMGLFMLNYLFPGYIKYSSEKEARNKEKYYALMHEKDEIEAITKNDTLFFLNPGYSFFFGDRPIVYGYDHHQDRAIEIVTGFHVHTAMTFVSPNAYDSLFENGNVQYIIAENEARGRAQIPKYYSRFKYYSTIGRFNLYKYGAGVVP
jgi:hypothetical protein